MTETIFSKNVSEMQLDFLFGIQLISLHGQGGVYEIYHNIPPGDLLLHFSGHVAPWQEPKRSKRFKVLPYLALV